MGWAGCRGVRPGRAGRRRRAGAGAAGSRPGSGRRRLAGGRGRCFAAADRDGLGDERRSAQVVVGAVGGLRRGGAGGDRSVDAGRYRRAGRRAGTGGRLVTSAGGRPDTVGPDRGADRRPGVADHEQGPGPTAARAHRGGQPGPGPGRPPVADAGLAEAVRHAPARVDGVGTAVPYRDDSTARRRVGGADRQGHPGDRRGARRVEDPMVATLPGHPGAGGEVGGGARRRRAEADRQPRSSRREGCDGDPQPQGRVRDDDPKAGPMAHRSRRAGHQPGRRGRGGGGAGQRRHPRETVGEVGHRTPGRGPPRAERVLPRPPRQSGGRGVDRAAHQLGPDRVAGDRGGARPRLDAGGVAPPDSRP